MSSRLRDEYRRWSLQQVVSGLAAVGRGLSANVLCVVDTAGDLPTCPTAQLEAHQNRVTSCMFHQRKCLLATRFDTNCWFITSCTWPFKCHLNAHSFSLLAYSLPSLLHVCLTPLTPAVPNCCCSKGSAPYCASDSCLMLDCVRVINFHIIIIITGLTHHF